VSEYYRKFKGMVDALADLGSPVDDRILILNILRDFNQRFEHVGAIIQRYSPFLNFLKVQDDLLLEEIHLDTCDLATASTVHYSNSASSTPKPQPSAPPRPPSNGNDNKNNNNDGDCGGNFGSANNDNKGTPPWSTFVNL
jgi:hypothetical protein